jgi:hypothetical protein
VAMEPTIVDGKEIRLKLSRPAELKTGHALSAQAAQILVGDLNGKVSAALTGMFDVHEARAVLPSLPGANLSVDSAEFAADGAMLMVHVQGGGKLTSEAFNSGLDFLSK